MVHWLDLIPPDIVEGRDPATCKSHVAGRNFPSALNVWDVVGEAREDATPFADIAEEDRSRFLTQKIFTQVISEEKLQTTFVYNICANFNETGEFGTFYLATDVRLPHVPTAFVRPPCMCVRSTAHIAAWDDDGIYATVNLEMEHNLHLPTDNIQGFCTHYNNSFGAASTTAAKSDENHIGREPGEELRKGSIAICQAFGQMMDVGSKFGILSCYTRTYFLRATSPTTVEISNPVPNNATAPTLLRIIAHVLHAAKNDTSARFAYPECALRRVPPAFASAKCGNSGDDSDKCDGAYDFDADTAHQKPCSQSQPDSISQLSKRKRGSGNGEEYRASPSSCLEVSTARAPSLQCAQARWGDVHLVRRIAQGRSGAVIAAEWLDAHVAVKVHAVHRSEDRGRCVKEMRNYQAVADCQGEFVPRVLFRTVRSPSGFLAGIGLELCQPLPGSITEWTTEQRRSARRALKALCMRHGLLQRDLRAENFCLNARGNVVVIDLEDCDIEDSAAAMKKYLREVAGRLRG